VQKKEEEEDWRRWIAVVVAPAAGRENAEASPGKRGGERGRGAASRLFSARFSNDRAAGPTASLHANTHAHASLFPQEMRLARLCRRTTSSPLFRTSPSTPRPCVKRMVLTESGQDLLKVGEPVPDFELPDVTREGHPLVRLSAVANGSANAAAAATPPCAVLVCWLCVHCPFVVLLKPALSQLCAEYSAKGVAVVAVSSNSPAARAEDGPDGMKKDAEQHAFNFPYLYDGDDQRAAKAWHVACTPEFFVLKPSTLRLLYHGQFDGARPGNGVEPTGTDLRAALDAVLGGEGGEKILTEQRRAIGCSIKWSEGVTPEYAAALAVKK